MDTVSPRHRLVRPFAEVALSLKNLSHLAAPDLNRHTSLPPGVGDGSDSGGNDPSNDGGSTEDKLLGCIADAYWEANPPLAPSPPPSSTLSTSSFGLYPCQPLCSHRDCLACFQHRQLHLKPPRYNTSYQVASFRYCVACLDALTQFCAAAEQEVNHDVNDEVWTTSASRCGRIVASVVAWSVSSMLAYLMVRQPGAGGGGGRSSSSSSSTQQHSVTGVRMCLEVTLRVCRLPDIGRAVFSEVGLSLVAALIHLALGPAWSGDVDGNDGCGGSYDGGGGACGGDGGERHHEGWPPALFTPRDTPSTLARRCGRVVESPNKQSSRGARPRLLITAADRLWAHQQLSSLFLYHTTLPHHTILVSRVLLPLLATSSLPGAAWLQYECGALLSRSLIAPGGVSCTLRYLLGRAVDSGVSIDRACARGATILGTCPRGFVPFEYYLVLTAQLFDELVVLMKMDTKKGSAAAAVSSSIFRCIGMTVALVCCSYAECVTENILVPSLLPLLHHKADEEEVDFVLSVLSLLVDGSARSPSLMDALAPAIPHLLRLYAVAARSRSRNLGPLKEILISFLHYGTRSSAVVQETLAPGSIGRIPSEHAAWIDVMSRVPNVDCMTVVPGGSGGLIVKSGGNNVPGSTGATVHLPRRQLSSEDVSQICRLLGEAGGGVPGNLFVQLLFLLKDVRVALSEEIASPSSSSSSSTSTSESGSDGGHMQYLSILQLLVILLDFVPAESLCQDAVQLLCVLDNLLSSATDRPLLVLCLGIVELLISNGDGEKGSDSAGGGSNGGLLKEEEEFLLLDLTKHLDTIADVFGTEDPDLAQLAVELKGRILGRAVAWKSTDGDDTGDDVEHDDTRPSSADESEIREALEAIRDPLLPVRAHGLIKLRRLVLAKNRKALANLDRVLDIFKSQLKDGDTYIYLTCIDGLAALGGVRPVQIIPLLSELFCERSPSIAMPTASSTDRDSYSHAEVIRHGGRRIDANVGSDSDEEEDEEDEEVLRARAQDLTHEQSRLKVGEALLKVARYCGETLPAHAEALVAPFLSCTADSLDLPSIRASCLSNLATLLEMLRFGGHRWVSRVILCASSAVDGDSAAEVRRAGVYLLCSVLRGMGTDVFEYIPNELKPLYGTLKRARNDVDQITSSHATIGVDMMLEITKSAFGGAEGEHKEGSGETDFLRERISSMVSQSPLPSTTLGTSFDVRSSQQQQSKEPFLIGPPTRVSPQSSSSIWDD